VTIELIERPMPWDVVVIGSGAVGGWASLQLSRRGLSVLVLEAGADGIDAAASNPRAHRVLRLLDRLSGQRHVQSAIPSYWELDPDLFVLDSEHPFATPEDAPFHWIRSRGVNGRLLTWGGIGVRLSDHELLAPEQDGFGEPWPLRYSDLAEHYDEIDRYLPVYGDRDGLPQLPDGIYVGSPRLTDAERRFQEVVRGAFPGRDVIAARGVLARPSARQRGEAPPPSAVREATARHGAVLRANAVVSHIGVSGDGIAHSVAFYDRLTGRSHEVSTRSIALCASTLESTRILLNSRSEQHPDGLGNSSGELGRNLMDHTALFVSGYAPGRRSAGWADGSGGPKNILIPRFHNLENSSAGEFLRGYGIFGGIGRHAPGERPDCAADEVPFTLVAYGEMLPRPENRVTIDPDVRDVWGIPNLHIACSFSQNEHAMRAHMLTSLHEMLDAAGARVVGAPHYFTPGSFVHEVGTARMGRDPATSVLNGFGQCWDVPNVYVMDGAAWTTSAWQNPTFTMMAIAGRASEHLAQQLVEGRLPVG
jgi:choline dehydrogenase-like flavoprotein